MARKKTAKSSSKSNRRKGARAMMLVLTAFLVAASSAGAYLLKSSGVFRLESVDIYGNKYLSKEEMTELMGIEKGENLIDLPASEVTEMLSSSKWVKSANVRKHYPDRLEVRIKEAVPAALLQVRKDVFFVDSEGNVLEKLQSSPEVFLPVIVSSSARNPETFKEAVILSQAIRERGLSTSKGRIEISGVEKPPENLTMTVDDLTVKVGKGKYEEKLRRLFELSGEIKRRHVNVKYVDLRFSRGVVVKPFKEAVN